MKKFWRVCWNEYRRHVFRKRFLMIIFSLPLGILAIGVVVVLATAAEYSPRPIGYLDQAGLIKTTRIPRNGADQLDFLPVEVRRYETEDAARLALDRNEIQAYFVVAPDYLQSGVVTLVAQHNPPSNVEDQFRQILRVNLLDGQPPEVTTRVLFGSSFDVRTPSNDRQTGSQDWLSVALPIASGILFVIVINTSGGYLLQAVVEEKENRTVEIVITSVSPGQLMAGKVVGNLSVGLTQLLVWLMFPLAAFLALRSQIPMLQTVRVQPEFVWLMLLTLLAAFILVAGLMAAIGATVTEAREAQQIAGLFTLPIVAPYWFMAPIIANPNSPLARAMSFFPLTAPVTLPLRAVFTTLPAWEILVALALLFASAAGSLWLAGRAFRLGMLRYGKSLSWKELFRT